MNQGYFIMKLWQTGNIGSHNICKADNNPKEGFGTYEEAEEFLIKSYENNVSEFTCAGCFYTFTIMKIYS